MDRPAKRSHHADKVSSGVPQHAPRASCSAWTALSSAVVLVCCALLLLAPAMQEQCRLCSHWIKRTSNRTHICLDCRKQQEHKEQYALSAAADPPPPPAPLFPSHAGSHSRLSLLRRAAIVILDKQGATRGEIAQQVGASAPTVRHWISHDDEKEEFADEHRRTMTPNTSLFWSRHGFTTTELLCSTSLHTRPTSIRSKICGMISRDEWKQGRQLRWRSYKT